MLYRIYQDETNVRWRVNCDEWQSGCSGMEQYNTVEQAYEAAKCDAHELKQTSLTVLRPGHERKTIQLD
jgi:hypothetical protein